MTEFESMLWPLGMMFPFVNVQNVLRSIVGWRHGQSRLLVIAGGKDTLMGVPLMEKMAAAYRFTLSKIFQTLPTSSMVDSQDSQRPGVEFAVVEGSGHHLQNDLQREECAGKLLEFIDQL
jgi:pimeloyl-ACP methyl ester carboxylesterase